MVDRRDISIPVNLAFLAALVAVSAFVTVPSPDRMEAAAPPEHSSPQPEQVPADVPAANAANDVLRLTSVMMPPMPDEPVPDEPVPDEPALAAKTSKGPSPDTPPTEATPSENINQPADPAPTQVASAPTQSAPARLERTLTAADQTISAPAALTPLQMTSADPTPRLVPQPAPVVHASASTISARRLTPLVPASAQKVDNSMPALLPISPPVPVASAAHQSQTAPVARIQQGMTKAEITPMQAPARQRRQKDAAGVVQSSPDFSEDPATEMTPPELAPPEVAPPEMAPPEVAPQASDWQVADRLMDKAAQRLSLEFLWPADRQSHARIYTHLANCLGVKTGIIDSASRVHLGQGGGRSFNTAMHSPFMRLVDRPVDPRESRAIDRIRDRQGAGAGSGRAVRVFRRSHDMWLLAALNRTFGGLPSNGRVTAEYNLQGGRLYLGKLTLDGRRYEGRISLDRDSCA